MNHELLNADVAEEMASRQRDISVSEFFLKNRHRLGFDSPSKAALTTAKERSRSNTVRHSGCWRGDFHVFAAHFLRRASRELSACAWTVRSHGRFGTECCQWRHRVLLTRGLSPSLLLRNRPRLTEKDMVGLKYFDQLLPLFKRSRPLYELIVLDCAG